MIRSTIGRHRIIARIVVAAIAALAALALLVTSGIVSIAASSGHWPMMNWFLHYAAQRSIFTHALPVQVPRLDDPALLRIGTVHYRLQCANCHGAPGAAPALVLQGMTPPPPPLMTAGQDWSAAELFWIVRHGIKYTAMPAWPSKHRDDDVWPVVTFLQAMPQLDDDAYRELSGWRDPLPGDRRAQLIGDCAACHGSEGEGRPGAPRLAGQSAAYLLASLDAYASGERHSGMMQPLAAALSTSERRLLADHYARSAVSGLDVPAGAAAQRGEQIVRKGISVQGVPACEACHDIDGAAANPQYPRLSGQQAEYIEQQLRLFREGRRGGSPYAELMRTIAERLEAGQAADVAAYYASRPAMTPAFAPQPQ